MSSEGTTCAAVSRDAITGAEPTQPSNQGPSTVPIGGSPVQQRLVNATHIVHGYRHRPCMWLGPLGSCDSLFAPIQTQQLVERAG